MAVKIFSCQSQKDHFRFNGSRIRADGLKPQAAVRNLNRGLGAQGCGKICHRPVHGSGLSVTGPSQFLHIVKMNGARVGDLIGFMSLASGHDDIVWPGDPYCQFQGLGPINLPDVALLARYQVVWVQLWNIVLFDSFNNICDNGIRRFGPWVVRGDNGNIRISAGHLPHGSPFGPVPVSPASEHGDQPGRSPF